MNGTQLNMTVDMIEGEVTNIYKALPNIIENATNMGATEVRIEAYFGNINLLNVLEKWLGMTVIQGTDKIKDVITIPILVNQIPK